MAFMSRPRAAHETRARRRQLLTYALCCGAFVLLVNALVGDNGYLATWRARREYASILESLERMRHENSRLEEQIKRINDDPAALEEAARRELNLIRPGETLVIIKDAKPAPAAPAVK
jgi:cell division protein FtsB